MGFMDKIFGSLSGGKKKNKEKKKKKRGTADLDELLSGNKKKAKSDIVVPGCGKEARPNHKGGRAAMLLAGSRLGV